MSTHTPHHPDPFHAQLSNPGTPVRHGSPWWLWVLTIGLLGTVVWLQRPEPADPTGSAHAAAGLGEIKPPQVDAMVIMGKLLFSVRSLSPMSMPQIQQVIDQSAGWEPEHAGFGSAGGVSASSPPKEREKPMPAADRLRATVLAGEHLGPAEIDWRLKDVERTLDKESPLRSDVALMRTLYGVPTDAETSKDEDSKDKAAAPAANSPVPLTPTVLAGLDPEAKKGFVDRHGWFADLALTRGDNKAPVREKAASDGMLMVVLLMLVGGVVSLAGLAGLVLLIIAAVQVFSGSFRTRFARPRPELEWPNGEKAGHWAFGIGHSAEVQSALPNAESRVPNAGASSSVWLETVAVFLGGFLALKLVGEAVATAIPGASWTLWVALLGQWALVSAIFWPVARGMSFERWRGEIGWHKGRGVLVEMGCGVMGYLACLPVYFGMAMVVVLVSYLIAHLTGGEPVSPADNKVLDLVEGGGMLALICVYLLATVWAPVVEESIFRGAMFRHLRRRTGLVLAALGSCMMFAILHGYVIAGLFMVGTLGFWFALMREWRGSLIAPATAHLIHNGVVLAVLITIVKLGSV